MLFKIKILIEILKVIFSPKFRSREALRYFQQKKIKAHLKFIKENAPFYENLEFEKLEDLPIIDKEVMMSNFDKLNTAGIKKEEAINLAVKAEKTRDFAPQINGITIGLSSGTSGNKSIFLASEKDRLRYIAAIFKKVLFPIKHFNTKVALFFRANSNLYESVGSMIIKFKYFDLTRDLNLQIDELNSFNPHILVAPPTLLNILATYQKEGKIDINPDKIISVAEVLEDDIKNNIENAFSVIVHQLYQCTEGFLASTCKYGKLHLHEDYIYFEKKWLDGDKKRFHPIITDFSRTTQAMIRYELNDILHIGEKCKCGSVFTTIDKIEGRSDDIFKFYDDTKKEILVFPDEIRNTIIISSGEISDYKVVQHTPEKISVMLKVNTTPDINPDEEISKVQNALIRLFESKGIQKPEIQFHNWENPQLDMKFRRIMRVN